MSLVSAAPIHRFIDQLTIDQLPPEVVKQAKICLADLLATLAAGSQTALVPIVNTFCVQQFSAGPGAPQSSPLVADSQLSPAGAALLDGMTIDAMDAHDGHSLTKGHVGCAVLATLNSLISSVEADISGQQLLCYLIAGYEIGTRSGIVLHQTCSDYHSSGAWNAVTCAALSAHFLKLDQTQFEHAIGIAEYHGPRSQLMRDVDHPTMVKDGSGWGAMAGVSAAYLAQLGFTGAPALTICEEGVQKYWQDLAVNWRIMEQYLKPYPVCRWAHPAIDAVLALKKRHSVKSQDIVSVTLDTFHQATRLSQQIPKTTDQAQYAIVFPIAVALVHDNVLAQHLLEDALEEPSVIAMFERIKVREDDDLSALFPAQRLSRVTIETKSGSYQSENFSPRGEGDNPLTEEERLEKYRTLTSPVWGEQKSQLILDKIEQLDKDGMSARELFDLVPRLSL